MKCVDEQVPVYASRLEMGFTGWNIMDLRGSSGTKLPMHITGRPVRIRLAGKLKLCKRIKLQCSAPGKQKGGKLEQSTDLNLRSYIPHVDLEWIITVQTTTLFVVGRGCQ